MPHEAWSKGNDCLILCKRRETTFNPFPRSSLVNLLVTVAQKGKTAIPLNAFSSEAEDILCCDLSYASKIFFNNTVNSHSDETCV